MKLALRTVEGQPLTEVQFTNEGAERFRWVPDRFRVQLEGPAASVAESGPLRLHLPDGWRALPVGEAGWLVFPGGRPAFPCVLQVVTSQRGRERVLVEDAIPVAFCGRNVFHPERHRLPWANRVEDLGEVEPDERHFRQTFRFALAPGALFRGLYREVVGLRRAGDGTVLGGLCTGLSRVALARVLGLLAQDEALRDAVLVLHGRQLSDRALLAGLPWFLFPSPRRAYRAFVHDLLERGRSERCFDINVPKPWRRDVIRALLGQGHTVVPYAFCQRDEEQACVWVYDPNLPDRPADTVIRFDLRHDTYSYAPLAVDGRRTTVVAVPLTSYLAGRSAVLAGAANLLLRAAQGRRSARRLLVSGAVLALVLFGLRIRKGGRCGSGRDHRAKRSKSRGAFRSAAAGAAWALHR